MVAFQKWIGFIIISAATATYFLSGCTRDISVTPTLPVHEEIATGTSTDTTTPTSTGGATNTVTSTSTSSPTNTTTLTPTNTQTGVPPNTPTNTPTSTNTNSPTSTFSPTATIPGANTSTATGTPTSSGTMTATETATQTSTATTTSIFTSTATPSATGTPTSCSPASVQTTYTFATSIDCWAVNPASTPYVTSFGISGSNTYNGAAGALKVSVDNTSGSTQNINLNLNYATPQNLSGLEMIAWVYVDSSLMPSVIQQYDQTGASWGSAVYESNWNPVATGGVWFPVTIVFGANNTLSTPNQTLQIGIQLTNVPAGAVGNFYVDDIQLIAAPPTPTGTATSTATSTNSPTVTPSFTATVPGANTDTPTNSPTLTPSTTPTGSPTTTSTIASTATPTSTASATTTAVPNYSWTFEDGSSDGFYVSYNTGDTITPNSYANLGISNASGGVSALDMTMLSSAGNDMQVESNYVWNPIVSGNGFPINFSAIGAVGVRIWVYPMTDAVGSAGYGAANYVKTTSGDIYGTGGLGAEIPGGYNYVPLTVGQWTEVSLQPAGAAWATDETSVTAIGIEINVYGGTQAATGDYIVDNMELY
jgi:hypothetical protein